jgi:alcohol dehydrogenase class IV
MTDFNVIRQYNFPTIIRFGAGAVNELPAYLAKNNLRRPLIVTDAVVKGLEFFTRITGNLSANGISVEVFADIHKNPVKSDVLKGDEVYAATERDCVIGIGGGAAMDVARAIVLRVNHRLDLFEYDDLIGGDQFVTGEVPHFITIPTTSGTGSEVVPLFLRMIPIAKGSYSLPNCWQKSYLPTHCLLWVYPPQLQRLPVWMHLHTIWKRS